MLAPPLNLVAELTHRCPLRCAYCSNPLQMVEQVRELSTRDWIGVFSESASLGIVQAHLTGGEPLLRKDLVPIARAANDLGLYTTLITSGVGIASRQSCERLLGDLGRAGVRAVQVSFQDVGGASAARVCGGDHFDRKRRFAHTARDLGMSLTLNVVLHRENIDRVEDFVELALDLGADRLELAHVQYHGWAALNHQALLPSLVQVEAADRSAITAKREYDAELEISYVMPDHFSGRARACMGGWGQRMLVIDPEGKVLPCHAARSLPIQHESVGEKPLREIWESGAAFALYRGENWMEEPCQSCPERASDFGGCRCQALHWVGRASAPDPACRKVPGHGLLQLGATAKSSGSASYVLRHRATHPPNRGDTHDFSA